MARPHAVCFGLGTHATDDRIKMKKLSFAPSLHLAVSALLVVLWAPQQAAAQTGYYMTLVSRVCDDYTDIMANRARNNIQESLRDLGPDTVYASGEPVTPALEDANNNCQPLASPWGFTLGSSIGGQDEGSYGRLSYVNGVNGSVATVAQVPELDAAGTDTGRTIDWAVTIELTPEQVDLASRNALWVQGGSPGDPLNGQASVYGFGALRCAIDGLNGDNVESNKFPTGTQHVFCYAYYVNPPPTSRPAAIRPLKPSNSGVICPTSKMAVATITLIWMYRTAPRRRSCSIAQRPVRVINRGLSGKKCRRAGIWTVPAVSVAGVAVSLRRRPASERVGNLLCWRRVIP